MRYSLALVLAACTSATTPDPAPASRASGVPAAAAAPVEPIDIAPTPSRVDPPMPEWAPVVRSLTPAERAAMTGVSWREGCPVGLDALAVLELRHHTPDGGTSRGELIVHSDVADDVVSVFAALWEARFPITQMQPVREFGGDDARSMAADNTSAFNCRGVGGGTSWSEHAYGRAIDVNPLRNPYVRGDRVDPPAGRDWVDRDASRPGVVVIDGPVAEAFASVGWTWGGTWRSSKDYQHFSKSGR